MDWIAIVILFILTYACISVIIYSKKIFSDHIVFYGPIMAIRTFRVSFFDRFAALRTFLRLYGTFGVCMVVVVSVFITVMLIFSVRYTLIVQPEPTGIYKPQNILLLPGINEYVPSTLAVWLAFIITIAVHEFGHGILCRIENITVKGMGILLAVIPIGFFVEPDEDELEKTKGMPKARMFGAGITNNLVVGLACFVILILLVGTAVPATAPVIHGIYKDYPADKAGVPQGSVVISVNGVPVATRDDVAGVLNTTKPGDTAVLGIEKDGIPAEYSLTLTKWPEETGRSSGFMGVQYYDGTAIQQAISSMLSPIGLIQFLVIPFDTSTGSQFLRIIAFDSPDQQYYQVPFDGYWGIVHILFWCGWININVGIFNAIPMIPLDGGYILKEGVDRLLDRRGLIRYSTQIVSMISSVMLVMLVSLILLPYLLHL
ncbi:MAG: zinc metallopeptidase RseP [Methanoregula sp. PtaU1.Bin051]|nr:MAG: zinc metallopeptidase RseP [Methanoregula sp. PtaU1.Bin051]